MNKIFKISGLVLLIFIVILIAIPIVLESKIDTIVKNYANENLNANLSFDNINLSLISSFPKIEANIENLKITNRFPFEGKTLATAKILSFEMPLDQLFKGSKEPLLINKIIAKKMLLTLKTNKKGITNYNIVKEKEGQTILSNSESATGGFSFDIENYELNNSTITYIDEGTNSSIYTTDINHNGKGIFSDKQSELATNTALKISVSIDSTEYFSNTIIKLDAIIGMNLEQQKFTFKDNKGFINAMPLEFEGFVKMVKKGQQIAISFKNPEATFKDLLAIIPKTYAKRVKNANTTGNFTIDGLVKGLISEETIPTLDINMRSNNASFKYPDLPKSIEDITINASIKNRTGNINDTYIDINTLNFKIDQDVFKFEAHIKNITHNILVNANLDGVLNFANFTKAYPIELEHELSGILKGELSTNFDINAIETNAFQRIKNNGNVSISNFTFSSEEIVNPIQINNASLIFKSGLVTLNNFDAKAGKSDFSATGTINNFLGFFLSDKKLQGNFNIISNYFVVSDFMVENKTASETSNKTASKKEALKIPEFLDCTITANATEVLYDNLILKNVKGQLRIKDQNAKLSNMTTHILGGKLDIAGNVSTKEVKPKFDMKLGMQQFDISQSFKTIEMLTILAPIAKVLQGKFNSTINVSGLLDKNFSPNLATITGNALAEILTTKVNVNQNKVLTNLRNTLDFIDLNMLDLKDLKTKLSFKNGQVAVQPFTVQYNDIPIEIYGTHSFNNTLNYNAVLQVPAKYLGSDINRLIEKIKENDKISIPVIATIDGTFSNPNIKTNLTNGISNLTTQLIKIQKQKLIKKGKDKANELFDNLFDKNSTKPKKDSIKTTSKGAVKKELISTLGKVLGGKKKYKGKKD